MFSRLVVPCKRYAISLHCTINFDSFIFKVIIIFYHLYRFFLFFIIVSKKLIGISITLVLLTCSILSIGLILDKELDPQVTGLEWVNRIEQNSISIWISEINSFKCGIRKWYLRETMGKNRSLHSWNFCWLRDTHKKK